MTETTERIESISLSSLSLSFNRRRTGKERERGRGSVRERKKKKKRNLYFCLACSPRKIIMGAKEKRCMDVDGDYCPPSEHLADAFVVLSRLTIHHC